MAWQLAAGPYALDGSGQRSVADEPQHLGVLPACAPHRCVFGKDGVQLPPSDVGRDDDGGSPSCLRMRHADLVQFTGNEVDAPRGDPADCRGDLGMGDVTEQLRDRIGPFRVRQDKTEQAA